MTEIAKELLEGVNINDRVKVRYGTSESQDLAEGIVVRISENFLSLQKNDGGAIRIRLDDSLRSLEVIMSAGAVPAPIPAGVQILKPPVKLEPAPPFEFNVKQWLVSLRNLVKQFDDATFKSNASSIIAAFEAAVKTNNLGYKYHDVRAKILAMWNDCEPEVEYEFFYQALGVLAVAAQDYDYALEPLTRAKKYELAAYAAELALKENYPDIFKICALLNDELSDITQDVAKICVKRRDADVLQRPIYQIHNSYQFPAIKKSKIVFILHIYSRRSCLHIIKNILLGWACFGILIKNCILLANLNKHLYIRFFQNADRIPLAKLRNIDHSVYNSPIKYCS